MLEKDYQWRGPEQELGLCMGSGEVPCTNWGDSFSIMRKTSPLPHWLWSMKQQQCTQKT